MFRLVALFSPWNGLGGCSDSLENSWDWGWVVQEGLPSVWWFKSGTPILPADWSNNQGWVDTVEGSSEPSTNSAGCV